MHWWSSNVHLYLSCFNRFINSYSLKTIPSLRDHITKSKPNHVRSGTTGHFRRSIASGDGWDGRQGADTARKAWCECHPDIISNSSNPSRLRRIWRMEAIQDALADLIGILDKLRSTSKLVGWFHDVAIRVSATEFIYFILVFLIMSFRFLCINIVGCFFHSVVTSAKYNNILLFIVTTVKFSVNPERNESQFICS